MAESVTVSVSAPPSPYIGSGTSAGRTTMTPAAASSSSSLAPPKLFGIPTILTLALTALLGILVIVLIRRTRRNEKELAVVNQRTAHMVNGEEIDQAVRYYIDNNMSNVVDQCHVQLQSAYGDPITLLQADHEEVQKQLRSMTDEVARCQHALTTLTETLEAERRQNSSLLEQHAQQFAQERQKLTQLLGQERQMYVQDVLVLNQTVQRLQERIDALTASVMKEQQQQPPPPRSHRSGTLTPPQRQKKRSQTPSPPLLRAPSPKEYQYVESAVLRHPAAATSPSPTRSANNAPLSSSTHPKKQSSRHHRKMLTTSGDSIDDDDDDAAMLSESENVASLSSSSAIDEEDDPFTQNGRNENQTARQHHTNQDQHDLQRHHHDAHDSDDSSDDDDAGLLMSNMPVFHAPAPDSLMLFLPQVMASVVAQQQQVPLMGPFSPVVQPQIVVPSSATIEEIDDEDEDHDELPVVSEPLPSQQYHPVEEQHDGQQQIAVVEEHHHPHQESPTHASTAPANANDAPLAAMAEQQQQHYVTNSNASVVVDTHDLCTEDQCPLPTARTRVLENNIILH